MLFTSQLRRVTGTPEIETGAAALDTAFDAAFDVNPRLRGYVLEDQGHLRVNVVVVDGRHCTDRIALADGRAADSRVYGMQTLSGGRR